MLRCLSAFLVLLFVLIAAFSVTTAALAETASFVPCQNALDGARYRLTSTKITAGSFAGKVLIVGGDSEASPTPTNASAIYRTCFMYDPDLNFFSQVSSMTIARTLHSAVALPDGRVLVAGGFNGSTELSSCEIYDPVADTWTLAGYLSTARSRFTLTYLGTGAVLAIAGYNNTNALTSCELYDVNADSWTPTAQLASARYDHAAIKMLDGRVLIAGGNLSSTSPNNTYQIFTPPINLSTAAWTPPATLPFSFDSFYQCVYGVLDNGDVVIGGSNSGGRALRYNGTTWSQAGTVSSRWGATQVNLPTNNVVEIGGWGNAKAIDIYLPSANTWSAATSIYGHTFSQCVLLNDGRVLLVAGNSGGTSELLVPSTVAKPSTAIVKITSAYGNPVPVDVAAYTVGATVNVSISPSTFTYKGRTYTVTGYSGTGSAPSGAGSSASFSISEDSTLTWNWTVTGGTYRLTVISDFGTANPPVGINTIASGTTINATVNAMVDTGLGIRYICTGWIGSGSAPLSGTTNLASFILNSNSTIRWQWSTEYRLAVENVQGIGAPYPPVGDNWFAAGIVVNGHITSPSSGFQIAGYEGTGSLANDILPSFSIVIDKPTTISWKWMQLGMNLTSLAVNSLFGNPTPAGVTVYTIGTEVSASVPAYFEDNGTRYECRGWQGSGSAPAVGLTNNAVFTIQEGSTINWDWAIFYLLIIVNNGTLGNPDPPSGPRWYAENSPITASVTSPAANNFCTGYSGTGSVGSSSATSVGFTISSPTTIIWNWVPLSQVDTQLEVQSDYGSSTPPVGINYYFNGAPVSASVESTVVGSPGELFICTGWTGTGSVGFLDTNPETGLTFFKRTGPETAFSFTIYNADPQTGQGFTNKLTWNWERRYILTVINPAGMPKAIPSAGNTPITAGSTLSASVPPSAEMSAGVRAFCIGFIGTGSVPANGTASTVTFVMSTPSSIQWLWEERYEVIVENPAGFGEPNPVAGTYFVSPGQEFTASNTDYFGPYALLGYILVTEGGSDVNSGQTVTITVTEPIRVVWEWNFVPVSWQPALPVATGAGQVPFYVDMERSPVTSSPWICYQDLTSKDLHAAFYSVDQWVNLTLDSFGDVGAFSNLKVSPEGDIYIAYYDETNRILKVAERIGGVWAISVVDDNAGNGRFCSINISPEGKIGISYLDNSDLARPKIKYAQKFQNDWIVETCREFSGVVEYLSLVYVNEQPMIAFYDATAGLLRYMYFDLEWIMDTIDGIPDVGRFCNAGVNPTTGRPEVVYYDLANRSLKYARRLPDFTWDIQTVDATGDVGYYPNISFDNNGKPNICYQDLGQQRLRFATFDGINWQLSTIAESTGNTNWFPALAKYLEQEFSVVYLDNSQMRYLSSQKFVDMNDFVVGKGGGCFVATAAFGTMASDSVRALTGTRDALLSASCTGASVLELYYSSSVSATRAETSSAALRAIVREWLMPFSR